MCFICSISAQNPSENGFGHLNPAGVIGVFVSSEDSQTQPWLCWCLTGERKAPHRNMGLSSLNPSCKDPLKHRKRLELHLCLSGSLCLCIYTSGISCHVKVLFPFHALAGNVCISKRRFLPWAAARAFMSFLIQGFAIYLCASYTSQWLFWSSLGSRALITKPGTEIFP